MTDDRTQEKLDKIQQTISSVRVEIASNFAAQSIRLGALEAWQGDHETRLRTLEHRQFWFSGAVATLGFAAGAVIDWFRGR